LRGMRAFVNAAQIFKNEVSRLIGHGNIITRPEAYSTKMIIENIALNQLLTTRAVLQLRVLKKPNHIIASI
jgi:hypothetical protein